VLLILGSSRCLLLNFCFCRYIIIFSTNQHMRARTMPSSTFPMLSSMVQMAIMKVFDTLMPYPTIWDWKTFIEHPLHGCHKWVFKVM
jgi:hypothetical protein